MRKTPGRRRAPSRCRTVSAGKSTLRSTISIRRHRSDLLSARSAVENLPHCAEEPELSRRSWLQQRQRCDDEVYGLGPRIGFAYVPQLGFLSGGGSRKLSIRGGYGIYYNRTEEESSLQNLQRPSIRKIRAAPWTTGVTNPGFANPFQNLNVAGPTGIYPNKFPFTPPAAGASPNFSIYTPFGLSQYTPAFRSPYSENVQLTIEREFPGRVVARMSYVGAVGRHNQSQSKEIPRRRPVTTRASPIRLLRTHHHIVTSRASIIRPTHSSVTRTVVSTTSSALVLSRPSSSELPLASTQPRQGPHPWSATPSQLHLLPLTRRCIEL